jgi:preprotein translocase subunit SecG
MLFTFLLIIQTIVATALVGVILMQRSEGGGLGVGGSSSGLMTARGAADFLTRSTAILAALFIILAIALSAIAGVSRTPATIDTSLVNQTAPAVPVTTTPVPTQQQPAQEQPPTPANESAPAVPLAQ